MFRDILPVLAILCSLPMAAQNTNDLTAHYGPPDLERYEVAAGVVMTVLYGKDRQACQLKIEGRSESILTKDPPPSPPAFSTDLADSLLGALIPVADRKGQPKEMFLVTGCSNSRVAEYENVRIPEP